VDSQFAENRKMVGKRSGIPLLAGPRGRAAGRVSTGFRLKKNQAGFLVRLPGGRPRRRLAAAMGGEFSRRSGSTVTGSLGGVPPGPPKSCTRRAATGTPRLGNGLIRDGSSGVGGGPGRWPRALETRWQEPAPTSGGRCAPTNRYRGSVLAELFRSLAALKALHAGADALTATAPPTLPLRATTKGTRETAE
jgi:hypothetical protein